MAASRFDRRIPRAGVGKTWVCLLPFGFARLSVPCIKESRSVRASWWASPTGSSRSSARASRRRSTDPGLVPAEIERFDRAVAASAAELEAIVAEGGRRQLGDAEADIFKSHLQIVNDPVAAGQGPRPDREPAPDGAVGASARHAGLRGAVRPDRAGVLPRADDRRPRRDLADRLAPDCASRSAPADRRAASRATATSR